LNFLGLEGSAADYDKARAAILPAPYEATCTYGKGASQGPEALIKASVAAEFYDESLDVDIDEIEIATLPPLELADLSPEAMKEEVYCNAARVVENGKLLVGLGGEHTVSLGFIKAVKERYPELSVLQIDAHPDLRDEYEGRKFCHATVGRRILDEGAPLVQVGLRAFSREEIDFIRSRLAAKDPCLHTFSADFIRRTPSWIDAVLDALTEDVYINLDVDGLDPSLIPHTGTPEPGGLGWWEICDLFAAVGSKKRIKGFDVVELAPGPESRVSDFTAARLCMRMIGLALLGPVERKNPPF
jgi:agmatinase